jgi:hypothetical protein
VASVDDPDRRGDGDRHRADDFFALVAMTALQGAGLEQRRFARADQQDAPVRERQAEWPQLVHVGHERRVAPPAGKLRPAVAHPVLVSAPHGPGT